MADIYEDVVVRLTTLGYQTEIFPDADINHSINCAAEHIKANINRTEIPDELRCTWVDMAAGSFLSDKKATGQLGENFDFSAPVKKITEGDVSIEYAGATDGSNASEARFDSLLDRLMHPPEQIFARFRRIAW